MCFSAEGSFAPQETLAMSGDIFSCHNSVCVCVCVCVTGIQWVEARVAAKHPTVPETPLHPTTENDPVSNVNDAKAEKR